MLSMMQLWLILLVKSCLCKKHNPCFKAMKHALSNSMLQPLLMFKRLLPILLHKKRQIFKEIKIEVEDRAIIKAKIKKRWTRKTYGSIVWKIRLYWPEMVPLILHHIYLKHFPNYSKSTFTLT